MNTKLWPILKAYFTKRLMAGAISVDDDHTAMFIRGAGDAETILNSAAVLLDTAHYLVTSFAEELSNQGESRLSKEILTEYRTMRKKEVVM